MQEFSQEQKKFIQDIFSKLNTTITEKTNEIRQEIKQQIIEIKDEIKSTTNKLEQRITDLEAENTKLKQNVIYLERRVRKNNIVIFGIATEETDLNKFILNVFNIIDVKIELHDINDVYRIKTKSNKNPVVVEFISFQQKLLVLKNAHKLKGKNIFISKDQPEDDRKKYKTLLFHQRQARAKGELAYIKGEKLYIGNEPYSINQLENPQSGENNESIHLEEKPNSAPSTPCYITRQKKISQEFGVTEPEVEGNEKKPNQTKLRGNKERESSATRFTRSKK